MSEFVTLDSGKRHEFESGMRRDAQEGKPRYDLIPLWFLRELAELMARGAEKYGDRNWELANSKEEADRMDASGLRHHFQYLEGDRTENHLAAVCFNLFAAEQTRRKVAAAEAPKKLPEAVSRWEAGE
ncbi:dATP/dGTP diphosphohydrolase domain-containing protein [Amycolatopsis anabasis]|uniref:dATP/dGTP diphosphohydrolase domain-containing protein n=1 Tax=Amycolatopsis anabasis TaxID=1840409 RepID=UPI00131BBBE2|nr:dATP/dGTP diphosphohydrolase domain-containing protein [Amycolatopsis anabasis]